MTDSARARSTPPPRWALAPGSRVWSGGRHEAAKRRLLALLSGVTRPRLGPIDLGFLAPASVDEAVYFVRKILPRLTPPARVWVVYATGDAPDSGAGVTRDRLAAAMIQLALCEGDTVPIGEEYMSSLFQAAGE